MVKNQKAMARRGVAPFGRGDVLGRGRYIIERELNRGGTAVVYQAFNASTGDAVAIKVLNAREGKMAAPVHVVSREVTYASSIEHERIVRLLDVFAEGVQMCIVWELVDGPDLLDRLNANGGTMSEAMAAYYIRQVAEGIAVLHARKLCHRDLKPENVMIDRSTDQVKLIDFGLAKGSNSARTLGVGTPDYLAPELVQPSGSAAATVAAAVAATRGVQSPGGSGAVAPAYDAMAVDLWALGVMLYLLVTGVYPFEDPLKPNNIVATVARIREGRIQPLPGRISAGCRDLITQLLQRDPTKRPNIATVLDNAWLCTFASSYVSWPLPASGNTSAGGRVGASAANARHCASAGPAETHADGSRTNKRHQAAGPAALPRVAQAAREPQPFEPVRAPKAQCAVAAPLCVDAGGPPPLQPPLPAGAKKRGLFARWFG
ncbi:unnamed protein product [Pedinophyceae sp. YPF-701]|nr:unnamed protein product [Pedinophyceae sp. YPF-701]